MAVTKAPSQAGGASRWHGWPAAIVASAIILAIYFFMSARSTLWDRDEPRFARATVEMIESGNYLYPTFNDDLRPDKPILAYWLMSLPMRLLGPSEFTARFWSPVGMFASCLLIYYMGRKLIAPLAGLLALAMYSLTLLTGMIGTAATADAIMIPLNLGIMAFVLKAVMGEFRLWHVPAMGVLFGLSMLTKSVFGLLPLVAVGSMVLLGWREKDKPLSGRFLLGCIVAALLGTAIMLAWFIPANAATGGRFMAEHLGRHIFQRATSALQGHGGRQAISYFLYLPFYLPVTLVCLFPWTLFLAGAVSATWGKRVGGERGRAFLLGWAGAVFVVMSLVSTKMSHYILMAFPALVLMVAGTLNAGHTYRLAIRDQLWLKRGLWLFLPVAALVIFGPVVGFHWIPEGIRRPLLLVSLIAAVVTLLALRDLWMSHDLRCAIVLMAGVVALQGAVGGVLAPAAEEYKLAPAVAAAARAAAPAGTAAFEYEFEEPSLNFYLGRHIERIGNDNELREWASQPGSGVLFLPRQALVRVFGESLPPSLREITCRKGYNYSDNTWLELVALERQGGQRTPTGGSD